MSVLLVPSRGLAAGPCASLGTSCRQESFRGCRARPGPPSHTPRSPFCARVPSDRTSRPGSVPISVLEPELPLTSDPVHLIPISLKQRACGCCPTPLQPQYLTLAPSSALGVPSASLPSENESVQPPFSACFPLSGSSPDGNTFLRYHNFKIMNGMSGVKRSAGSASCVKLGYHLLFFRLSAGCTKCVKQRVQGLDPALLLGSYAT